MTDYINFPHTAFQHTTGLECFCHDHNLNVTLTGCCSCRSLPWTCVWYTTKYSSFPQLSNSSPWQRWRHMSSSSSSWRENIGVGKPQWHRSPASTASDFSWNTAVMKHCTHVHEQSINTHPTSPHPLCAHVHTLVHRHVLDDGADRKCQRDIVRPVETPFENGTAVWNRENEPKCSVTGKTTISISVVSDHWPLMKRSHCFSAAV